MTRETLFVLTFAALALAGCGSTGAYSSGNQRSIDADIAAAHDQGPTAENLNPAQISVLPTVTLPFKSAY